MSDIELNSARRSKLMIIAAFLAASVTIACVVLLFRGFERQRGAGAEVLPDYGTVPSVEFVDQSGEHFSLDQLRGSIWVADFIFTRCSGPCPIMSARMSDLQKSLRKTSDVKLVSITVDPEYDTPERLAAYAERYDADPQRWHFVTGEMGTVQELAVNTFRLAVQEGTDPDEPIVHSTRFVLVDANGRIRGYYNNQDAEASQRLLTDIGALLREME